MPFGDYFKLPEGFKERRSAPNRMEGLTFGQKLNYMGQFEGPSLMALGAGIMEGEPEQGWRDMAKIQAGYQENYAGEQEENRVREQTMQYLLANGIDPAEAQAASQNPAILKHIFSLEEDQARATRESQLKTFGTPQWYTVKGADGKEEWRFGVLDNQGNFNEVDAPAGGQFVPPGDIAAAKAGGTVAGKFDMEQAVQAPGVIASSEDTLHLIGELERDSRVAWGTGLSSIANALPGDPGYDFANRVKQINSQAMTQAIQKLHGLGAMSDADRDAAMSAATRVNVATSEAEFNAALADYKYRVQYGMEVARQKAVQAGIQLQPAYRPPASTDPSIAPAPGAVAPGATVAPPSGAVRRYNPQTGRIE